MNEPVELQAEQWLEDVATVRDVLTEYREALNEYHKEGLQQSQDSFRAAVFAGIVGLIFFIVTVSIIVLGSIFDRSLGEIALAAVLSALAGSVTEVVAAINFWVYGKATDQMNKFYLHMSVGLEFLLANSITSEVEPEGQDELRHEVVQAILRTAEETAKHLASSK